MNAAVWETYTKSEATTIKVKILLRNAAFDGDSLHRDTNAKAPRQEIPLHIKVVRCGSKFGNLGGRSTCTSPNEFIDWD